MQAKNIEREGMEREGMEAVRQREAQDRRFREQVGAVIEPPLTEHDAFSQATSEAAEKFDERDEEMSWIWLCAKLFFRRRLVRMGLAAKYDLPDKFPR